MKFLCDQMLGTLAKWLRIYGFDTYFASSEISDDELLEISKDEGRTLVTRDKDLIQRARKKNIKNIELKTTDIKEQLKIVLKSEVVDKNKILSRCTLCNTLLSEYKKEDTRGKIPERIFNSNEKFWYCKHCDKIYWKGTHYESMIENIKKLKNQ